MRSAAALLVLLCGCRPLPDGRTAVEHEREAEQRRLDAEAARATAPSTNVARAPQSAQEREGDPSAPIAPVYQARVARSLEAAERHEEAARRIRLDAAAACLRVPREERRACPLGGAVARIEMIPLGVRVHTQPPPVPEALREQVKCALAEARVELPPEAERCLLLVPRTTARVVDTPAGASLEIVADDDAALTELRQRARAPAGGAPAP